MSVPSRYQLLVIVDMQLSSAGNLTCIKGDQVTF